MNCCRVGAKRLPHAIECVSACARVAVGALTHLCRGALEPTSLFPCVTPMPSLCANLSEGWGWSMRESAFEHRNGMGAWRGRGIPSAPLFLGVWWPLFLFG
jgi:hypothetical protein